MIITVVGTGGVGGYFGGKLALASNKVTFVARGKHLEAIQKNGLKIRGVGGDFIINPANATADLSAVKGADLVIVATKAEQVKKIAEAIAPYLCKMGYLQQKN